MLQQTPIRRHRLTAAAAVCLIIVLPRTAEAQGFLSPSLAYNFGGDAGSPRPETFGGRWYAGPSPAPYYATRIIKSFLFQVTPHDPPTLSAAVAVLAAAAYLAAWLPAPRAAAVNPIATCAATDESTQKPCT